jgi:hypothetical protein
LIRKMLKEPDMIKDAMSKLSDLQKRLLKMHSSDDKQAQDSIDECLSMLSNVFDSDVSHAIFNLAHDSGQAPQCSFESVSSLLLDEEMDAKLREYNPYLSSAARVHAENLLVGAMFSLNRSGHTARCILNVQDILEMCERARSLMESADESMCTSLALKASSLAELLCTRRGYTSDSKSNSGGDFMGIDYDPRFLVFEFTSNIMLRISQIKLVRRFMKAYESGGSLCHQLIMGAGKTTVIAPILALILGSPKQLVVQVFVTH